MAGRNLDARTLFFYVATVNTPAMAAKMVGQGLAVRLHRRRQGRQAPFDGAKTYRLNIPANVPAKDFWSVVLYDPQTRSELQTSQPFPSKNNKRDKLIVNADGSVDLYFGPKAPAGKEANWIADRPRQGLVRAPPPLRPARAVVRQDLAAGRDRGGEVSGDVVQGGAEPCRPDGFYPVVRVPLHSPKAGLFDGAWKLPDVELIK